ncbi:MAG: RNB domain-containing ribonuclease, partial [Acidobacteriaceae bacterium]
MSEHNHRHHGGTQGQSRSSRFSSHTQDGSGGHDGSGGAHREGSQRHGGGGFDLAQAALDDMHEAGFRPEFGPGVDEQMAEIEKDWAQVSPTAGVEDLRGLGWSSIDNDTSKDLDQIEVAERVAGGVKLRVAIGDVAAAVRLGTPIDQHAQAQTQTIYTAVKNFPMLPLELSTGLTSLNEAADRQAVMMTFTVGPDGEMLEESVSVVLVRNRAQLAYSRVGPWLEKTAAGAV